MNVATDPNLYRTVSQLVSADQVDEAYRKLYETVHGESGAAFQDQSPAQYSFANPTLYQLAHKVADSDDPTRHACQVANAYKQMFVACHGDLKGAFTTGDGASQGELYSNRYRNILWDENGDRPEMTGYLLSVAQISDYATPAPLPAELGEDVEQVLPQADPDAIAAEAPSEDAEPTGADASLLTRLSSQQCQKLNEAVESFDCAEFTPNLPISVRNRIAEAQRALSDSDIANLNIDDLVLSYRLAEGRSVPKAKAERAVAGNIDKSLIGGAEGYRHLVAQLRVAGPSNETDSQARAESTHNTADDTPGTYQLSDPQVIRVDGFRILEEEVAESDSPSKKVRVPVAVKGEWHHPEYGKVSFTQSDFDQMLANFQQQVTGYEPPLFLGHENPNNDSVGGQAAVGFLERLYQEGDNLFGEFEMVDDEAYEAVSQGKYRYASPEYAKQAVSKKKNETVGSLLMGTALTNRPHLTGMPRTKALTDADPSQGLSDAKPVQRVFDIGATMTNDAQTQQSQQGQQPIDQSQLEEIKQLTQEIATLQKQNQEKNEQIEKLQEQINELQTSHKEDLKKRQLSSIQSLNLPQSTKDKYREMVENDRLEAGQFEEVYQMLTEVAGNQVQQLTEQHGQTTATQEENQEQDDPQSQGYDPVLMQMIEENRKAAEKQNG